MKKKPTKTVKVWGWFNVDGDLIGCSPPWFNRTEAEKDITFEYPRSCCIKTGRIVVAYPPPAKPRKR